MPKLDHKLLEHSMQKLEAMGVKPKYLYTGKHDKQLKLAAKRFGLEYIIDNTIEENKIYFMRDKI
jgi:hypothetical protein